MIDYYEKKRECHLKLWHTRAFSVAEHYLARGGSSSSSQRSLATTMMTTATNFPPLFE